MRVRLETPRLILTVPTREQIEGYHDAIVGTSMFDTILWDGPESSEDLHDYWAAHTEDRPDASLAVAWIERDSDRFVGSGSLRVTGRDPRILDVGYALAPAWHGRGYATEAVGALVEHGFASRDAERIFACIFDGNRASSRVVEKLGFTYEGTHRRSVCKRGTWVDEQIWAKTRPDWLREQA